MFGMGMWELVVVVIVAIVMIGPKDLPRVLRTAGQWAGRLRRMALDLRVQSGIDDVLHNEGLAGDIQEIRKLARGELDNIRTATTISNLSGSEPAGAPALPAKSLDSPTDNDPYTADLEKATLRHREYPREGADSYNAMSDTAVVFVESLVDSPLAKDPLYVTGDPNGVIPPKPGTAPAPPPHIATEAMPTLVTEKPTGAGGGLSFDGTDSPAPHRDS